MDSKYKKVFGGNSIEAHRVELSLKDNNIEPILKDESESDIIQIFVHEDEEVKALELITQLIRKE